MNKKKLLVFALCVALIITLCSCGTKVAVEKELIGIYIGGNDLYSRALGFNEDGTYYEIYEGLGEYETEGTWKLQKNKVILQEDDGSVSEYTYEYDKSSGKVTLYWNNSDGPDYGSPYIKYKNWS